MNWFSTETLALAFAILTALAILVYAILDGYDLGVGITLPMHNEDWRDTSIASIGPFWDANETWLVLAVGLLLVAFPAAHSAILRALYLPATALLIGLILRGVAFDFRAKTLPSRKIVWDWTFKLGSILSAFSQGFMLGIYVVGLKYSAANITFGVFSGLCVTAAYALIGNAWLILKTSNELQRHAVNICKKSGVIAFSGILVVSLINPIINANAYHAWTQTPLAFIFAAIPLICFGMLILGYLTLARMPLENDESAWLPFAICCIIFVSCFIGLAISFYPYVVPNQLTIWDAASAAESLNIIFIGAIFVVPTIAIYTGLSYYAFRGKAEKLEYY